MAWSYDPTDLDTTTDSGRLNTVRLLIGDTDSTDEQMQNEEVTFALSLNNDSIYNAAIWCCRTIASKYSRLVTTELDGALKAEYSDLAGQYYALAEEVDRTKNNLSANLGSFFGGTTVAQKRDLFSNPDRTQPKFYVDQWDYWNSYDDDSGGYA